MPITIRLRKFCDAKLIRPSTLWRERRNSTVLIVSSYDLVDNIVSFINTYL